jgi:hypothetical protein
MESCDPSAACLAERANQRTGLAPYGSIKPTLRSPERPRPAAACGSRTFDLRVTREARRHPAVHVDSTDDNR